MLVTDTVGFIQKLPTGLVEAFKSTLEEVAEADLLLHVVDGAGPDPEGQMNAVRSVLREVVPETCRNFWHSTKATKRKKEDFTICSIVTKAHWLSLAHR